MFRILAVADRLIHKFFDVLQTRLGLDLSLCFQFFPVAGIGKDLLDQCFDADLILGQRIAEFLDLTGKYGNLSCCLTEPRHGCRPDTRIVKADSLLRSPRRNLRDRCRTNASFWHIDDTLDCQIIPSVCDCFQIRQYILDLFSLIEIYASYQTIRHVVLNAFFLQKTGLRIRPVKDRVILKVPSIL